MKTYLLLRNNKETGPYSLDQLVKLGLKKYDLVWAEGRSAAWLYPGEIDELKPYAPALDELPFSEPVKMQDKAQVAGSVCNADVYAQQKAAANARPKPRIRIKAEWSRIETPAAVLAAAEKAAYVDAATEKKVPAPQAVEEKPTWESQWLNWQAEQSTAKQLSQNKPAQVKGPDAVTVKTAVKNTDINTAYASSIATAATSVNPVEKKGAATGAPVLETKFSQSLTDIKQKYADTVLKAKMKAGEPKRFKSLAIVLILAMPVMCIGVWLGSKWTKNTDAAGQVVFAKTTTPNAQPGATQPNNDDAAAQDNAANTQAVVKNNGKETIPNFEDNKEDNHNAPVAKRKTVKLYPNVPLKKQPVTASKQTILSKAKNLIAPPTAAAAGQRVKTINKALAGIQNALHLPRHPELPVPAAQPENNNSKPAFPHTVKNESIDDYVAVEADKPYTQSVQDVKLNVQNIADVPLDLVVIDVEYFDAGNRFKNGQTVRIKDIPAGETIRVNVPDNPNATKLRYKVSLVSADRKNVYIVGE